MVQPSPLGCAIQIGTARGAFTYRAKTVESKAPRLAGGSGTCRSRREAYRRGGPAVRVPSESDGPGASITALSGNYFYRGRMVEATSLFARNLFYFVHA